jgi:hypothetical protein
VAAVRTFVARAAGLPCLPAVLGYRQTPGGFSTCGLKAAEIPWLTPAWPFLTRFALWDR